MPALRCPAPSYPPTQRTTDHEFTLTPVKKTKPATVGSQPGRVATVVAESAAAILNSTTMNRRPWSATSVSRTERVDVPRAPSCLHQLRRSGYRFPFSGR
jgi:hypothetical protein